MNKDNTNYSNLKEGIPSPSAGKGGQLITSCQGSRLRNFVQPVDSLNSHIMYIFP